MKNREKEHHWLAKIIAKEEPEWLKNANEKIFKALLTQEARFWWGGVHTRLMPTTEDNILGDDRVVLVTSIMSKLP